MQARNSLGQKCQGERQFLSKGVCISRKSKSSGMQGRPAIQQPENIAINRLQQQKTDELEKILQNNREWAQEMMAKDPMVFKSLSEGQAPEFLWIGCSDSRIVVNESTGLGVGEVFIHRNVGNIVSHQDLSCMSVIQFAVEGLGVKHIIVCGHYGCGAVQAALRGGAPGSVDLWIDDIRVARNNYADELNQLNPTQQLDRLSELNVVQQVYQVCSTPVIQNAWKGGNAVHVHGLIYDIKTGGLKRLLGPVTDVQNYIQDSPNLTELDQKLAKMLTAFQSFNAPPV
eukprot:TRINITY_DN5978_c0_g1_i1.p1 TRINITY_DN5978_c0_g1~~TRINITY_DN5978_c0_g1_i1.p1  ORF type:complete len:285 (-),score=48.30 TRINITY_DN5978_c0_g1_i1:460-1314(-)